LKSVTYCHECKKTLLRTKNKKTACAAARGHMAATSHILVFGYTLNEACEKGLIGKVV